MAGDPPFHDLMRRVRAGDEQAAPELVRAHEAEVREAVRRRLRQAGLCRLLDSMDIAQSVFGSFFVRAAAGQYNLEEPGDLVKLLVRMARNKVIDEARKRHREKAHTARTATGSQVERQAATDSTPSQHVAGRELYQEIRRRLTPDEQQLADRRAQGQEWAAIAGDLGGTAQGRRKQLERALNRVAQELGLEEVRKG